MKGFLLLLLLSACSHKEDFQRPLWVQAVRSGHEALKVKQGTKTFYRRIAGAKNLSRETSCDYAIQKAEEDLKKEYPGERKIPYTVEVLFYDQEFGDCATTLSVNEAVRPSDSATRIIASENSRFQELKTKSDLNEDEVAELLRLKGEIATKFALTGLSQSEYETHIQDKVTRNAGPNLCYSGFKTLTYSIHGPVHICWKDDYLIGYCFQRNAQCWTNHP